MRKVDKSVQSPRCVCVCVCVCARACVYVCLMLPTALESKSRYFVNAHNGQPKTNLSRKRKALSGLEGS